MVERSVYAKVSRPRLFGVVPRERLFRLLDENAGRPLIWVAGPPGAGKTALLASYIEQRMLPSLWYQVDAGDADPASFFHYLLVAAQAIQSTSSAPVPRFAPEHAADIAGFARIFFRAFFAHCMQGALLVLDNYQEMPADSAFHDIVRQAVLEAPPGMSLVVVSRTDPPVSFVQLAVSGAMFTAGWEHLQLTLEEVGAICAQSDVNDAWLVNALHRESHGWAGGVTLMLERLHHLRGSAQQLSSETRESVFNYFASLIFDQAPQSMRAILISVAFLPRVLPSMATTLSGSDAAPALLEDLYRRRLFTDRRPSGSQPVYQFHALFLDFLRVRALATLDSRQLQDLQCRTALALEDAGDIDSAMDLWLECECWEAVTRVVLREASRLLNQGRRATLERWLTEVPESVRADEPWMIYWLGRASLQIDPSRALGIFKHAAARFRARGDAGGYIECLADALNAAFVGFHATAEMDRLLDELLAAMDGGKAILTGNTELRVMSVLSVTLFHVRPWHPLTMPSYLRMEELLQVSDDPAVALLGVMATLVVSGLCGDFDRGDRMAYLVEPLALRAEASPSDVAWTYAQIGWLRFAEARYDEALAVLRKAYEIAQRNGLKRVAVQSLLWRYTIEWRMGDWPAALAALAEAETSETARPPMAEAQLRLFQARAARHRGEPREASRLACLSQDAAMRVGSRVQELVFCVSNADVQLDAARIDLARPLIATARALIERAPLHRYHWPSVLLLEARCLIEDGDLQAGLQRLREALTAALEANHRFYLRVCDWSMPGLFVQALKHRIEPQLVVSLIRMFRLRPPSDATDDWPWPVRVLTLGCFSVHVDGQPLEFSRKLPRKTLLLLKAIVAHGGREVSEQVLCDALWADEDGDAARNALSITLLRLRKLLKHPEAVVQQGGRIWLNRQCCWVDAWSFLAKRLGDPEGASEALSLYRGTFLPGDEPEVWSVPLRERLRARFVELLLAQGGALEESGDQSGALQCYARGIETDAIVEAFYAGAMRCYERLGRRTEAFSVYRRLRQTLSVILGVEPSEATQRLFAEMVRRQNSSAA